MTKYDLKDVEETAIALEEEMWEYFYERFCEKCPLRPKRFQLPCPSKTCIRKCPKKYKSFVKSLDGVQKVFLQVLKTDIRKMLEFVVQDSLKQLFREKNNIVPEDIQRIIDAPFARRKR